MAKLAFSKLGLKVNNEITGSNIETCPKEFVPTRIQELLYKYNNEWALELPPYKLGDSEEIREKYYRAICEREAKFHIEFERIHPFEDGNGSGAIAKVEGEADIPVENPTEDPDGEVSNEPTDEPDDDAGETPTEKPLDNPTEIPSDDKQESDNTGTYPHPWA